MLSKAERSAMGKKSRQQGARFELKVRHDLEDKKWIVCKWANNIELEGPTIPNGDYISVIPRGKLISAKHTFNPFTKAMSAGSGFPDFVAFRKNVNLPGYTVIAVESKMTGVLDKKEKDKINWLLENEIFEIILVASKSVKRGEILYEQILKGGKRKENEKVN